MTVDGGRHRRDRPSARGRRPWWRRRQTVLAAVLVLWSLPAGAAALPMQGVHTRGDGFTPILFEETGPHAGLKIWSIFHHGQWPMAAPKIFCTMARTGAPCVNKTGTSTWPLPLRTTPGPLGEHHTGDLATTQIPQYVLDPTVTGQLYYPAVTTTAKPGFPTAPWEWGA